MNSIEAIQGILGVTQDGIWGPKSQAAFDVLIHPTLTVNSVIASSFADPRDVAAFNACKAEGKTDEECFQVGDNAIGVWDDSTAQGTGPSCALPPEVIEAKWGSIDNGKHRQVIVSRDGFQVTCTLKDIMPHLADLENSAHIDLNPDACVALGISIPAMVPVTWSWI